MNPNDIKEVIDYLVTLSKPVYLAYYRKVVFDGYAFLATWFLVLVLAIVGLFVFNKQANGDDTDGVYGYLTIICVLVAVITIVIGFIQIPESISHLVNTDYHVYLQLIRTIR